MQNKETIENNTSKERVTYTSQANNEDEGMVVYDAHVPNYSNHKNSRDKFG